jgi:ADP-ribosylglycohydrolase
MKKNIGLLTAMAIGDSFGRSYEFATKDKIDPDMNLDFYHPAVGKYSEGYKGGVGKYTDDTQMSIAIAEHMLSDEKSFSPNDYAESLIEAYERDKREGYSKRFHDILNGSYNAKTFQHNIGVQKPRDSNGSVIRCLPLGLYPDVNMVKHACIVQTCLTHPTMDCIIASQMVALAAHYCYYGHKKTFQNWITDHLPFGVVNQVISKYTLGDQVECDAIQTASYCLNVAFNQTKFKKLVVLPEKVQETKTWNGHGGTGGGSYTSWVQPPAPAATMSEILKHAIVEVGGDTDSTAAIGLGLAALRGAKNDLHINLYNKLENNTYGRDYLMELDKKLMEKFPRNPVKPEKIKIKVETIAEREARELAEKMPPIKVIDKKCNCSRCLSEKNQVLKNKEIHKGFHIDADDYEGLSTFYGYSY